MNIASFSIRFRDSFGNLTDTPIPFVRFGEHTGASSGTLTLTRSSVGVSTATVKRFYEAGDYTMWVDGMTTTTGSRSFTVVSANDNRVTFSNVPSAVNAGSVLPSFNLRFVDAFGNLTDNGVGRLTYRKSTNPVSTATLALTRLSEGLYTAQSTICTIAGTYNLAMSSIVAANTFGTKSFVISSLAAVSATFSGVTLSLNAGALQAAFDVRFRDGYGNNTDFGVPMSVTYSNSTNATNGVSTGTIAVVRRLGIGVYEATRATFTSAANYTLSVSGVNNTGHRFFVVKPAAVNNVLVQGVPASLVMGTALPPLTLTFRDLYRNLVDAPYALTFSKTGAPASTGALSLQRVSLGITTATSLPFTIAGNYTLDVATLSAANTFGRVTFTVTTTASVPVLTAVIPTNATVTSSTIRFTVSGSNFVPTSVVKMSSTTLGTITLPTQFVDANTLTADFSVSIADAYSASVFTPTPGGGTSQSRSLIITPVKQEYFSYLERNSSVKTLYDIASPPKILVKMSSVMNMQQLSTILNRPVMMPIDENMIVPGSENWLILNVQENTSPDVIEQTLLNLHQSADVVYAYPFLTPRTNTDQVNNIPVAITNRLVAKPKQGVSDTEVRTMIAGLNSIVIQSDVWGGGVEFSQPVYTVEVNIALDNAMNVANRLVESGKFIFAHPDFLSLSKEAGATANPLQNTFYNQQWQMNGGFKDATAPQTSISRLLGHLNVPGAWSYRGKDIRIATIDNGVQLDHPDLAANIVDGKDFTGTAPGGNATLTRRHGTYTAGIIAALDNDFGVIGIAPESKIVPIKGFIPTLSGLENLITNSSWLANALIYAANTAEIISMSFTAAKVPLVLEALDYAAKSTNTRRGAKGTIAIASSGNVNVPTPAFPAYYETVIGVGGNNINGCRFGYTNPPTSGNTSAYGVGLDIMAPWENIWSIDLFSNEGLLYKDFGAGGGTSIAAPQIAAIVALMVSANPSLTIPQIRSILFSTATKQNICSDSPYQFTATNPKDNSPNWNNEMGHGIANLVGVMASVSTLSTTTLQCPIVQTLSTVNSINLEPEKTLRIQGKNLLSINEIKIDGVIASFIGNATATEINVICPLLPNGQRHLIDIELHTTNTECHSIYLYKSLEYNDPNLPGREVTYSPNTVCRGGELTLTVGFRNFLAGTRVEFQDIGGIKIPSEITSLSPDRITFIVPLELSSQPQNLIYSIPGVPSQNILIRQPFIISTSSTFTISTVSSSQVQRLQTLTVYGTGFTGTHTIRVGNTGGRVNVPQFTVVNDNELTLVIPPSAPFGNVVLECYRTSDCQIYTKSAGFFISPAFISSVSPAPPICPNQTLTLHGQGFQNISKIDIIRNSQIIRTYTNAQMFSIGNNGAEVSFVIDVSGDLNINCTLSNNTVISTTVSVTVLPSISQLLPPGTSFNPNDILTIQGTNLLDAGIVRIFLGGVPLILPSSWSNTEIQARVNSYGATGAVTLVTSCATVTKFKTNGEPEVLQFNYQPPSITSLFGANTCAGTILTIEGENFALPAQIVFSSITSGSIFVPLDVENVVIGSNSRVAFRVTVPQLVQGGSAVVVRMGNNFSGASNVVTNEFLFAVTSANVLVSCSTVSITSVSPTTVCTNGNIRVLGTELHRVQQIRLNNILTPFVVVSTGELSVTLPPGLAASSNVSITLETPEGIRTTSQTLTILDIPAPNIRTTSPDVAPGNQIRILGTNFIDIQELSIAGRALPIEDVRPDPAPPEYVIFTTIPSDISQSTLDTAYIRVRNSCGLSALPATFTLLRRSSSLQPSQGSTTSTVSLSIAPNPNDGAMTIAYSLQEDAIVTITIVNMLQQTVAVALNNEAKMSGSYTLPLSVMLSSGTYTARIQAVTKSGRMIVQSLTLTVIR